MTETGIDLRPGACLIGGAWVTGESWISVEDPASGAVVGRAPLLGAEAARGAIAAAEAALPGWRALTAQARATILLRLHALMLDHADELAAILTSEQGKPIAEAKGEIVYAASFVQWFAEEGKRAYGDVIPAHAPDRRLLTLRQPVGVVAAITPWNFPAAMVTRKLAPALAAGCTMILKPAEQTPLTALAIAALAEAAGVPAGVFNVVTGKAREIGGELTASETVRKLSFTGSTEVGALLYAQSAPHIRKLSLELGGNAPFIVFDDADVDAAVAGAIASKFRNAGQTCVCANRFYVQDGIHDRFVEAFTRAVGALSVGPGEEGPDVGPLVDHDAVAKVEELVADAVSQGASVRLGGARGPQGGRFYRPTVLCEVTSAMRVTREEIFGPVAPVVRFRDEAEVLERANASPFGLAAYFFSSDLGRVWRVAEGLDAGMVGINTGLISTEVAPFGGIKASGLGREGGRQGLDDYLETKYLCMAH
jgi:succinate-semialdehyde dehydrogenase/glutarate-semialdehyde dehydrogenase